MVAVRKLSETKVQNPRVLMFVMIEIWRPIVYENVIKWRSIIL